MTHTTTYVTCPDCEHRLTFKRETACEPDHYECKGCGAIFNMAGEKWKPILQGRDMRGA